MKKIEIWSSYPPPYGGISIHSYRLFNSLKSNLNYELLFKDFGESCITSNKIKNAKNIPLEILRLFSIQEKYIHFHSNNHLFWIILGILPMNVKYIVTIHNLKLYQIKGIKSLFIKKFLTRADKILVNSNSLRLFLMQKYNIKPEKIIQLEAFLQPLQEEYKVLPDSVMEFRKQNDLLISGNAYKLYKDKNNIDVYGLDLCIKLIHDLNNEGFNVGLIFCLPQIGDRSYWEELKNLINSLGLNSKILILRKPLNNAFQVWGLSDLFLRPTNTDVEAISVKEALSQGVKVVASDVCERPPSTFLFESRNYEDLKATTIKALNQKTSNISYTSTDTVKKIDSFYKALIS